MKPSFLLDSSACIPVLRNSGGLERLPDPALTGIPVIVAAELWTGVKKNLLTHPHQAARLEASGKTIAPLDLLIAAQARSLGAVLVTANSGEFKRVKGLKLQTFGP